MRPVLLNPHVDDFLAEPVHFRFLGRRALKKYGFLLDGIVTESGECWVYSDSRVSAFIPSKLFLRLPSRVRKVISTLEIRHWMKQAGLYGRIKILDAEKIDREDILIAFSYKSARGRSLPPDPNLAKFKMVVYHLSHYFTFTSEKADYLKTLPNLWLSGDSDISQHPYFKKFFSWYRRTFLFMPFAVSPRFINHSLSRDSKCVATGTFHDLRKEVPRAAYEDYMTFTGLSNYHPIRAALFKQKNTLPLSGLVECMIRPYRSYDDAGRFKQFIRHFLISQKQYFSIDIVDVYNRHRLAVVGEEQTGFPALGAFEAMACGAVLVAHSSAYEGYGLVPRRHYLPYDGTVEGLISVLLEARFANLSQIAEAGEEYVKQELSNNAVYAKWMDALVFASAQSSISPEKRDVGSL